MMKKIIIYYIDVSRLKDEKLFEKYFEYVSDERKNRIKRTVNPKAKLHILGSGIFETRFSAENIRYNENGKPICDNFRYSLSHSGDYAVFVMNEEEIGIDIQKIEPISEQLSKKVYNEVLSSEMFISRWTKTESIIKFYGKKLSDYKNINDDNVFVNTVGFCDYYISVCTGNEFELELKEIIL